MSKGNKSSSLWNVLDPDDPYDIKKSMIARLPDHPSQPMGTHLQLVCLLQAAEIERLSDYLTEIKAKYREVERRELDRHSYEVQIKELAEKTISLNTLQKDNERLRDFIRRQGIELEEMQKKNLSSANFQALQAKYEGVLNELRISRSQQQNAEKVISRLNLEVAEWRGRWQKAEQERVAFTSQFQMQWRQKLNLEIKTMNQRADQRAERLQVEIRQLREVIETKNLEIQSVSSQRDQFVREVRLLQQKNKNKGNIQEAINQKNREIQRLNGIIAERTARLDQVTSSAQRMTGELNILEERYRNSEKEREKIVIKLRDFEALRLRNQNLERMEEKVAMMSMEIERLNGLNAARARECADANAEIERLKFQLRNSHGSKDQLDRQRQRISKLQAQIQILRVAQSRVKILTDELDRVRITLNTKNEEFYLLQQRFSSAQASTIQVTTLTKQKVGLEQELQLSLQKIDSLKNTINANQMNALDLAKMAKERSSLEQELQAARAELRNYRTITDSELNGLKGDNQRMKQQLEYSVSRGEYDKYRVETDRLRAEIERIRTESINIRKYFQEQKSTTLKIQNERNSLMSENQNMLNELLHLKKEIESLKVLVKTFEEKERQLQNKEFQIINLQRINNNLSLELEDIKGRNEKLEGSVESIYNEIERLHAILATRVNENQKLQRDISQYEQKCRFYQSKLGNSTNEREYYQQQVTKLRTQLQTTTKMANETSRDLMNRINDLLLEKQRNDKLISQKDKLIAEYTREKENLQRKLVDVQREFAIKISVEEQLKKERDQVRAERQRFYEEIRIKQTTILQLQTVIREKQSFGRQSQGKAKVWQSRVTEWQSRLKDAERGIQVRNEEVERHKQENERLNTQIQRFSQQLQEIVRQRDTIINENNQLKRRLEELMKDEKSKFVEEQLRNQLKMAEEALFRERKQSQNLRNNCRVFEQNLTRQGKQLQSLRQNVKEYQLKIVHIENTQTKVLQQRIKDYDRKLQERQNLIITLQRQTKQMETQLGSVVTRDQQSLNNLHKYEEKISLLSVEIQRLNIKLQEKARECREKDAYIQNLAGKPSIDKESIEKLKQNQAKLTYYVSQIDRLKLIIVERQREIVDKGNAIQSLTIRLSQAGSASAQQSQSLSRYKIEITNLQTALEQFENINAHTLAERDELFKVSHELKEQLDQLAFRSAQQEKHLRTELNYRLEENRRFGEELGMLKKRQQTFLLRIEEHERNAANRNQERMLKGRIAELQSQLQAFTRESNEYRIQNTNLKQQLNQLMIINHELDIKINESSHYSRDEFSRITTKVKEMTLLLQSKDEEITEWDQKYSNLYAAYEQLYHNYQITKNQYEATLANIKIYEAKLFKIDGDYEILAQALRSKDQQIYELKMRFKSDGDLYQKNLMLSKQIDRLTEINKKLQIQISELRLTLTDNVSLQKRLEQQLGLMVVLFAEIESLRGRLINSEQECEEVRRSSMAPFRVDRRQ